MTTTTYTLRERLAWAFYDWANSVFTTAILVAFFPIFFRKYWAEGLPSEQITLHLGTANAIASFTVMVLAPFLGAIADQGGLKKRLLGSFAALGVTMTLLLTFVAQSQWQWAMAGFIFAVIGFLGANIFYDSLLVDVSAEQDFNRVSALGYGLGYLGGGIAFTVCVLMTLHPEWFGIIDKTAAVRWAFVFTALWWALFSIPLFLWVRERVPANYQKQALPILLKNAAKDFIATFRQIRQLRPVALFLLAYWFYIDGVDTIIVMSIDYGQALNFPEDSLIKALLMTQFIAFPAALVFGWLGNKLGAKRGILIAIVGYMLITIGGSQMQTVTGFYALALCVGLFQGGIQALSRSLYASLIPVEQAAKFFGFYNMLGKFASVLGPILVGWGAFLTGSPRMGLLAVLILFILGGILLWRVPTKV
ncbi:MFS transporter [Thiolinea disciformis]|uniref:MFS transporter n=1 Tax=Thiolinea disciformis TaxID=125614 RepID=UPI000371558B|nr:MFS transporter [Thiolinea disciformis]